MKESTLKNCSPCSLFPARHQGTLSGTNQATAFLCLNPPPPPCPTQSKADILRGPCAPAGPGLSHSSDLISSGSPCRSPTPATVPCQPCSNIPVLVLPPRPSVASVLRSHIHVMARSLQTSLRGRILRETYPDYLISSCSPNSLTSSFLLYFFPP